MLFGDNLLDFDDPQQPTQASREQLVNKHQKDFGKKYIIFPNPMYGSWESVLYNNDFSQSDAKRINYVSSLSNILTLKQVQLSKVKQQIAINSCR